MNVSFLHVFLGVSTISRDLQDLSLKYFSLQIVTSGIYLSYAWISLYYLAVLNSFSNFGTIVAIGMLCGAILDLPLGLLTDRFGQRIAFCSSLFCLAIYYLGLIFATKPVDLVFLEIIVGIYSALLSGSFVTWFMNSWEVISQKETNNGMSFRIVMGNITFAKTIITSLAIFLGGYMLQQDYLLPQTIFLFQALIAVFGIILGMKFISPYILEKEIKSQKEKVSRSNPELDYKKSPLNLITRINYIQEKYTKTIPFFVSFSLLFFTSYAFNSLIFSALVYEISSPSQTFHQTDITIQFATISVLLLSITRALSDFTFAIFSRLSGKVTAFIQSPYKGILLFYCFAYPIAWLAYLVIMIINFSLFVKLGLIVLIFFLRIALVGLSTGLYYALFLNVTSSKIRSSQESLFNTINLVLSIIGFEFLGEILDSSSFVGALIFLLCVSCLGVLVLIAARNADIIKTD